VLLLHASNATCRSCGGCCILQMQRVRAMEVCRTYTEPVNEANNIPNIILEPINVFPRSIRKISLRNFDATCNKQSKTLLSRAKHPMLISQKSEFLSHCKHMVCGRALVNSFRPEGGWFESCSSCHVRTLGKSFTCSCLYIFGM